MRKEWIIKPKRVDDQGSSLAEAGVVSCDTVAFTPETVVRDLLQSDLRQPPRSQPTSRNLIFMGLVASVVSALSLGTDSSLKPFD